MEEIFYPKELYPLVNDIVNDIRDILDPECILFTGSFGKESWLCDNDKLLSDFEFVFLCKKMWSLNDKNILLNSLNQKYKYKINLQGYLIRNVENKILSNYSFKNPGYISLNFYDTFVDPHILFIKDNNIKFPHLLQSEIPIWEGWKLVTNRCAEFLYYYINNYEDIIINYALLKCYESIVDSILIKNKIYAKNINIKINNFLTLIEKNSDLLFDKNSIYFKKALIARMQHDISFFKSNICIDSHIKSLKCYICFIEKDMYKEEGILYDELFYKNYLKNKKVQKKYSNINIYISNLIILMNNKNLIKYPFKYYTLNKNWQHVLFLTINSLIEEYFFSENFNISKLILSNIINKNFLQNLDKQSFSNLVLKYWKILC